jgi:aromatic ring-opening dioxygenase catalytic subunit (LigB family)
MTEVTARQPAFFIPHGGGPCFFMPDPAGHWTAMANFLRSLPDRLPTRPRAILIITGHWETRGFALTAGTAPSLIYDYYGFPPDTYRIEYPAHGAPAIAARAAKLLGDAGLEARLDGDHGFDHGVFIPLKVAFPGADIPVVAMSVDETLDPVLHLAAGRALAPLRDDGVLIIGSGMSFHNMRGYGDPAATAPSAAFDAWLTDAIQQAAPERDTRLSRWADAPARRFSHPREEHLVPLMVTAGTATGPGESVFQAEVLRTMISGFVFP